MEKVSFTTFSQRQYKCSSFSRWFLLHWLIFHLLLLIILFIVSVIFFSVEVRLRKLLGVVPVLASFFFMYCWSKVYELFCYISLLTDPLVSPFCEFHPPPPYCLPPAPYPGLRQHSEEAHHEDEEEVGEQGMGGLGTEFYPVDPLSRGMMDRLVALNRNMYGSTYVPFHNDDDYVSQVKDYDKFTVLCLLSISLQKSETYAREISREDSRREQVGGEKLSAKYKSTLTIEI